MTAHLRLDRMIMTTLRDTDEAVRGANMLVVAGDFDPSQMFTDLRMPDGRVVRVPSSMFELGMVSDAGVEDGAGREGIVLDASESHIVPIIEETLLIGKKTVTTGTVRLRKSVQEFEQTLDEPLAVRTFDVERVILNRPVEQAPAVRQEGDTTVYSLVEEQLVMTKQLILKEELRVTKRDTERRDTQVVTLRRDHLTVEREAEAQ